jgi:hypothetical protein
MKKTIILLAILMQSCTSTNTVNYIKTKQLYGYSRDPFTRDTIKILSIKEKYVQYYSSKKDSIMSEPILVIASAIEWGDLKLINKK